MSTTQLPGKPEGKISSQNTVSYNSQSKENKNKSKKQQSTDHQPQHTHIQSNAGLTCFQH